MNLNRDNDHPQGSDALNPNNPAARQPEDATLNVQGPVNIGSGRSLPEEGSLHTLGVGKVDTKTHGANCWGTKTELARLAPFWPDIKSATIPVGVKFPSFAKFTGKSNPEEHIVEFHSHMSFYHRYNKDKDEHYLMSIRQRVNEAISSFQDLLQTKFNLVLEADQKIALIAFIEGLRMSQFILSLLKKKPSSLEEVNESAYKYIWIEYADK
ncbi:hypothetical protein LIER_35344 [Lithospermum erythrorhizon]|uniref:Uncharacterized protein n=1 Tax=Lithospermum erythrorhizon TaxID=34254 RepID=A0AAV3NP78_LITER